jgi:hypothetical protein
MPEYVYRNPDGEQRSIIQSMRDEHPEAVGFNTDGSWFPLVRTDADPEAFAPRAGGGGFPETYDGRGVYRRVLGNHLVNGDPCTKRYPYASNALPESVVDAGWAKADPRGRPIVRSEAHAKQLAERTGMLHYD